MAPEVVVMTTSGATSNNNVGTKKNLGSQYHSGGCVENKISTTVTILRDLSLMWLSKGFHT